MHFVSGLMVIGLRSFGLDIRAILSDIRKKYTLHASSSRTQLPFKISGLICFVHCINKVALSAILPESLIKKLSGERSLLASCTWIDDS